jgi:hypothetical protein
MRAIFKNPTYNKQITETGFIKIPFLEEAALEELRVIYNQKKDRTYKKEYGFSLSIDGTDANELNNTIALLRDFFRNKLSSLLIDVNSYGETFLEKEPNPNSFVPPHQDWSFTDEKNFNSYKAWIPLQDTTIEMGTLGFIIGSHRFCDDLRGSPLPFFTTALDSHTSELFNYLNFIEIKKGEAFFFDDRILHGSLPNTSTQVRLAVGFGFIAKEAPMYHYHLDKHNRVHQYSINADFFLHYSNAKLKAMRDNEFLPADLKELSVKPHQPGELSKQQLEDLLKSHGNTYQHWLDKIKTGIPYPFENSAEVHTVTNEEIFETAAEPTKKSWFNKFKRLF